MTFNFLEKVFSIGGSDVPSPLQFYKRGFELNGGGESPSWQDIILSGTTALTLTNALANGINYLKLFGGTEQRNLPSGYTQVEYLESDGTQYIDTGIKPTGAYTVIAKAKYNDLGDGARKLFGSRNGTGSKEFIFTAASQAGSKFNIGYGTHTIDTSGISSDTDVHIFKLSKGTGYVDNTVVREFAQENFEGDYPLYLFGANYAGTENGLGSTRFYYVEIYNGNDALVQNLIPCKRNSDSVLGMFDTVSQTFFTNAGTGSFTAGADVTTPSPDYPMDIISNNGVLKVSRNLFDYEYFYDNYMVPSTSTVGRVAIKLLPNTNYTVSTNTQQSSTAAQVWTATGSDPNAFSPVTTINGVLIDTPRTVQSDNNGYIILALRVGTEYEIKESDFESGNVWVQIELGSTVTPYTPYSSTGIYADGTVETVTVTGKNLFNETWEQGAISGTLGKTYEESKTTLTTRIRIVNEIYLDPTKTYTISINNPDLEFVIQVFNEQHLLYTIPNITNVWGVEPVTFAGAYGVAIALRYKTQADILPTEGQNAKVQLEAGSTATTYEEYFNGGQATAEMLLKVGTYQDVQEVLTGSVTRNIGIKVLDGTENWEIGSSSYPNRFTLTGAFNDIAQIPNENVGYSNCYTVIARSTSIQSNLQNNECGWNTTYVFCLRDDRFTTIAQFKQYLSDQYNAGTPVIIVYPLATATTETVTGQALTTQAGTNIVEITQSAIDNLELEVSYKAVV